MKLAARIGFLLVGAGLWASGRESEDIELTGLADFGTSRMACLKVAGVNETLTLHPGETASGVTLKDLDAHHGWAWLERGTNLIRLHIMERCTSTQPVVALPSERQRHFFLPSTGTTFVAGSVPADDSQAVQTRAADPVQNNALPTAFPLPLTPNNSGAAEPLARDAQLSAIGPGDAAAPPRIPRPGNASPTEVPTSTDVSSAFGGSAPITPGASQGGNESADVNPTASSTNPAQWAERPTDPSREEGDRIRTLYGTQAFLAWELAQGRARYAAWSGQ